MNLEAAQGQVRRQLIHYGAGLILALCMWGHVSEMFDHWDNTFQTGNDIEYSTVIVVLITGSVIGFGRIAALALRTVSATSDLLTLFCAALASTPSPVAFISHSPPQPLRI